MFPFALFDKKSCYSTLCIKVKPIRSCKELSINTILSSKSISTKSWSLKNGLVLVGESFERYYLSQFQTNTLYQRQV